MLRVCAVAVGKAPLNILKEIDFPSEELKDFIQHVILIP